jgi:hypothetical protein
MKEPAPILPHRPGVGYLDPAVIHEGFFGHGRFSLRMD